MIKTIQNWLDVRKQYKLEQQRQELINVAKVIVSDIMRELVKYDIECAFEYDQMFNIIIIKYSKKLYKCLRFQINHTMNCIDMIHDHNKIATYEHLKWYQHFTKKSTKKKFYHAEDAVKAISNMIIMGEAV